MKVFNLIISICMAIACAVYHSVDLARSEEIVRTAAAIMCLIFAFCGFGRVAAFHPRFRKTYSDWLKSTPWNGAKLPGGSVTLNLQDLILIAVTCLFFFLTDHTLFFILPVASYFAGYNFALLFTLPYRTWYIPAYTVILLALFEAGLIICLSVFILMTVLLVYLYLIDRRKCFPDRDSGFISFRYDVLSPNLKIKKLKLSTKLLIIGLYSLTMTFAVKSEPFADQYWLLFVLSGVVISLFKWISYSQLGYCTGPIYRIKKFLLWDYKYDRIFIIPFLIFTVSQLIYMVIPLLPGSLEVKVLLLSWVLPAMALFCGPGLKDWLLTGKIIQAPPGQLELSRREKDKIQDEIRLFN